MKIRNTLILVTLLSPLVTSCSGGGGGSAISGDTTPTSTDCSSTSVSSLEVVGVTPDSGTTNVSVNTKVSAQFNTCVDFSTINSTSFLVTEGSQQVSGTYSYDAANYTLSFTPANSLSYDATYLVVLTDAIKGVNGESFAGSGWGFFTRAAPDTVPPITTTSVPAGFYNTTQSVVLTCDDGETGTGCGATYYTTDGSDPNTSSQQYSSPISISSTTTLKYFSVDNDNNSEAVNSTEYIIDTVPPTIAATSPSDNTSSVPVTTSISVTFDEPILESTLSENSFTVDNGVTGTITYDPQSMTATLTPYERLSCNTTHTVNIGPEVTDLAGNALTQPASWRFTTNTDCDEPVTSVNLSGGVYTSSQAVTLSCDDGGGAGCSRMVYTTDGSIPSFNPLNGTLITGGLSSPISIGAGDTTLRYFAEDNAGNREVIRSQHYAISNNGFTFVSNYSAGLSRGPGQVPDNFVSFIPPGNTQAFYFDPSNGRLYRGAERGLYVSDDSGLTWSHIILKVGVYYRSIKGVYAKGSKVYLSTSQGLYISTDGGASYQERYPSGYSGQWINNVVSDGNRVYVATGSSGLWISKDKGYTFTRATTTQGLGSDYVNDVVINGTTIYVATNVGLSISTDGGTSFINKTTTDGLAHNTVNSLVIDNGILYAGTDGGLSISTDMGSTFSNRTMADGLYSDTVNDVFVNADSVYLATGGAISYSTNAGTTFASSRATPWSLSDTVFALTAIEGKILIGQYPSYYETSDNGSTWEAKGLPGGMFLDQVKTDDGTLYIHLSNGSGYSSIVMTRDYGQTFTIRHIGAVLGKSATIDHISVDGNTLYVATAGIAKTTDGLNYTVMTNTQNGLGSYFIDAVHASGNTIYAVSGGSADISTNGGTSFTDSGLSGLDAGNDLVVSGNDVYMSGSSGLTVSNDDWVAFVTRTTADGLPSDYIRGLAVDSSGNLYASMGSEFGVQKSTDKGLSFSPLISTGSDPSTCGGSLFIGGGDGIYISLDEGASFTQRTSVDGLLSDTVTSACYVP